MRSKNNPGPKSLRENAEGVKKMLKSLLLHSTVDGCYPEGIKTKDPGAKAQIVSSLNGPTKVVP